MTGGRHWPVDSPPNRARSRARASRPRPIRPPAPRRSERRSVSRRGPGALDARAFADRPRRFGRSLRGLERRSIRRCECGPFPTDPSTRAGSRPRATAAPGGARRRREYPRGSREGVATGSRRHGIAGVSRARRRSSVQLPFARVGRSTLATRQRARSAFRGNPGRRCSRARSRLPAASALHQRQHDPLGAVQSAAVDDVRDAGERADGALTVGPSHRHERCTPPNRGWRSFPPARRPSRRRPGRHA